MSSVHLSGQLVCATEQQAVAVVEHLPLHTALSRAEPGCLSFAVTPTEDPMVWEVDERFDSEAAFAAHQDRVASRAWGRATSGIERRYTVGGTP